MDTSDLYDDILARAYMAYDRLKDLMKEIYPEKWYDSTLKLEIIDSDEINGKSWCEETTDHVEMNKGVIEVYYRYFRKVSESLENQVLKNIVPDEREEIDQVSFESVTFKNGEIELIDSKIMVEDVARLLEVFVSRFILMHELGHIFNGHCSYLADNNKSGLNYMPMYFNEEEEQEKHISALDIRTMEMDADAFAATQGFQHVLHLYNHFATDVMVQGILPLDLFFWWMFALRSHFLLCEDHFMDHQYYREMSHLPSSARWNLVMGSIDSILHTNAFDIDVDVEKIYDKLVNGAIGAEKIFNEIKFTSYSWREALERDKDDFIEYGSEVQANWKQLRDKLEDYSRLYLYDD